MLPSIVLHDISPPICNFIKIIKLKTTVMKSFFLCLLLTTIFFTAKCQINKGFWLVGGSGSFYSDNETYTSPSLNTTAKYTIIDVSVSLGYFIINKFAAGLRPSFSSYKGEVTSPGGGTTNSYKIAVGPFVRYYFLNTDKPFNILADVGYQFGLYQTLGALHSKGKNNAFSAMGGTEIFFNSTAGWKFYLGTPKAFYQLKILLMNLITKKAGF